VGEEGPLSHSRHCSCCWSLGSVCLAGCSGCSRHHREFELPHMHPSQPVTFQMLQQRYTAQALQDQWLACACLPGYCCSAKDLALLV
jgi:hypothetical protein